MSVLELTVLLSEGLEKRYIRILYIYIFFGGGGGAGQRGRKGSPIILIKRSFRVSILLLSIRPLLSIKLCS